MAGANSNIQLAELDFDSIKNNFKSYLKSQSTFTDYDFEGSGISTLLDILAYNTHYNAYYLNMVADEMFLDSATQRNSIVSHAKLLNYTPSSATTPKATVDIKITGIHIGESGSSTIYIPRYTKLLSEPVDGVSYVFLTNSSLSSQTSNTSLTFSDVEIIQGKSVQFVYTVDKSKNPTTTFKLPNKNIDLKTINVIVRNSGISTEITIYNKAEKYLGLDGTSEVYFIQESMDGYYEIYFGDGILGKSLVDGNTVDISYIITEGTSSHGANSFTLLDGVMGNFYGYSIIPKTASTAGKEKESIESIKFTAPKAYSAQNRAVTKEDYIYVIKNNSGIIPIDAVNVWGGEENVPPIYGKVFISIKPKGGYSLTTPQKAKLIEQVIKPISMLTVKPEIIDVNYTYITLESTVLYDKNKTSLSEQTLIDLIKTTISTYSLNNLNKFDSVFKLSDIITSIHDVSSCIVANETTIRVQKKVFPLLNTPKTYTFNFNMELKRDGFNKVLQTYPAVKQYITERLDPVDVYFEEDSSNTSEIETIEVVNAGYGYTSVPSITIYGDGSGASAHVEIVDGLISNIIVDNPGNGYTDAVAVISGGGGTSGKAIVKIMTYKSKIVSYYYDNYNKKQIIDSNVGYIDYKSGIVEFKDFIAVEIEDYIGQFTVSVVPKTTMIKSIQNNILTIDELDPKSINITLKV